MSYVGLDVLLNSAAIRVVDDPGRLIREGTTSAGAPSIALCLEPFDDQAQRAGLEAESISEWLTANLIQLGFGFCGRLLRSR